jgi:hypothetical protein
VSSAPRENGLWTPIKVGIALTALVLIGFGTMAIQENCIALPSALVECRANWATFLTLSPNEVGDTLAGFAGALAFIWIVVTVWLQSSELAQQREVLREQKEEFKLMVAAQNAQVRALEAQALILENEQKQRNEIHAEKTLYALYDALADRMDHEATESSLLGPNLPRDERMRVFTERRRGETSFDFIHRNKAAVSSFWVRHDGHFSGMTNLFRGSISFYHEILEVSVQILQLQEFLHTAQIIRMKDLSLGQLVIDLKSFVETDLWHDDAFMPMER